MKEEYGEKEEEKIKIDDKNANIDSKKAITIMIKIIMKIPITTKKRKKEK